MGDRYRGAKTKPTTTHNGCLFPTTFSCDLQNRYPEKLLWQASPGGGPLVISADGSVSISNSPLIRQWSANATDGIMPSVVDVDGSHSVDVSVEVSRAQSAPVTISPSDMWRNTVKYIQPPDAGTVVAIQSQLHDQFYLMAFPREIKQRPLQIPVRGGEPDGSYFSDTRTWWRPVKVDRAKDIIILQYYGENYRYSPDDSRSLFLIVEVGGAGSSTKCSCTLRPRRYANMLGKFQWGKVA